MPETSHLVDDAAKRSRTLERLAKQAAGLFGSPDEPRSRASGRAAPQHNCATIELNQFLADVADAPISKEEADGVLSLTKTSFQHEQTTTDGHFLLKWDSTGTYAVPQSIVDEAGADLMAANQRYTTDFGQSPSPNVVEVLFDNALTPQTAMPSGPISLPAGFMNSKSADRLLRTVTVTHELFHVLQGGFGYSGKAFVKWFLEGGATWAEATYCNAIAGGEKLSGLFSKPLKKLRDLLYTSLSFLIFLENFFYDTKTGAYFMVDWMRSNLNRTRLDDPIYELDKVGAAQRQGFGADRLLVQFALQLALKTWYQTASGVQAIPEFSDADGAGHPVIPYAAQTVQLPPSHLFGFTGSLDPGLAVPFNKLRQTEFFFIRVDASSATSPFNVAGWFAAGQKKNAYVGAAVINAHTGAPVDHHSQLAESTAKGDVTFTFSSDTEAAYFVTTGGSEGRTLFSLMLAPETGP